MTHVLKAPKAIDKAILEAYRALDVATVYEASGRKGYIDSGIKPAAKGDRICGPAYTVQCAPGDNLMLHKALQRAPAGSVLVASVGGAYEFGYWGGMMATAAQARGLVGLAIDGCVRDSAEIARMGFPMFCRGFAIRGTVKTTLGIINYPINFGEATIFPGDLIMGDEDGMVVVRAADCAEVLEKSLKRVQFEADKAAQLESGVSSVELNSLDKVFESLGLVEE
ncbi:MAG: 4-hydroxy-4-methyl-2-oxoglutarate aldolase [Spirochaetae bacterium HGW-Spirochaetae-7]|jgi:4-hydroxy-4-methyl-2-oxoglutarate aldolase|nr:MAG: 4-hydroxy-4-methyl-2-oxoglutarate aldolase [Spirochaetae bacterium HGW-Spirochaetae-7]